MKLIISAGYSSKDNIPRQNIENSCLDHLCHKKYDIQWLQCVINNTKSQHHLIKPPIWKGARLIVKAHPNREQVK